MNGEQGVPKAPDQLAWQISETALDEITNNPAIAIATTKISMDEAIQIAEFGNNSAGGLQGIADITGLGLGGSNAFNGAGNAPLQPIEVAPPPSPPATGGHTAWRAELRQALQARRAANFFNRPTCARTPPTRSYEPNHPSG